jgi:putative ABC transport system permease protein
MLKNYLLIALRVLKKNTLFSAINIAGLSIGLAASIIIYLWVYDELSYDRFHENAGRIFRVERDMTMEDTRMQVAITSAPVGPQIKDDYPVVEGFVRLAHDRVMVEDADRNQYNERFFYADDSFFTIFSFSLLEGNAGDCLVEPFTVAISRSYAIKYFGEIPEPGSILNVNYSGDVRPYRVTAIFEDFPRNSHIQADLIGSFSSLYDIRHEMMMNSWMASNLYTYILLSENADAPALESDIQEMVDDYFGPEFKAFLEFDNPRDFLRLTLRPVTDIHLNADRVWEIESPGSKTSVMVFSLVSLLLLVIAGINFMNLSTARASRRALEVGVRKVSGASKPQLVRQFLGESALFSFIALVLAVIMIELVLPRFSQFTGKSMTLSMVFADWNPVIITGAWLALAFFAGAYPAFFLSSYKPSHVLKGKKGAEGSQFFRRVLVTGQFAVSIGLIICAISVYRQLQYINNKDLGYDRFGLINIRVENRSVFNSWEALKDELAAIPEVKDVSRSMVIPTDMRYMDNPHVLRDDPETYFPIVNRADDRYLDVFGMRLLAGSNFTPAMVGDTAHYYIINDAARRMFGFEAPSDAVGHPVGLLAGRDGETRDWGQITGVVDDFHYQPLTELIKPMVISSSLIGHSNITLKVDKNDMARANRLIGDVWRNHFPGQTYASTFVSQNFDRLHLTESRLQVILLVFTFLSVFVACLGLLGLSAFSAEQRFREIGVRKAFGASSYQIITLISSEFARMVLISCLVALPVAWFVLREWLNNFPYRRDIEIWVFAAAALMGLLTALATVLIQTWKASNVNPVETLKYE